MTTRRDFLKTLAALSGGYIAARFSALELPGVEPEVEIAETPVTTDDPLSWLELDGERFALLDASIDYHAGFIEIREADPYRVAGKTWGRDGWTLECTFPSEDYDRLYDLSRQRGTHQMMMHTRLGYGFSGEVAISDFSVSHRNLTPATSYFMAWDSYDFSRCSATLHGLDLQMERM